MVRPSPARQRARDASREANRDVLHGLGVDVTTAVNAQLSQLRDRRPLHDTPRMPPPEAYAPQPA
ncbi:hypothetical protein ACTVZO_40300 [Streptomyces sp. IBSNAI002]|uniref:hypothetical protein n=1 Tax=Streptomyces sp. IBSNAI002 TaxID=3457500 RepID=UPI003FD026FF